MDVVNARAVQPGVMDKAQEDLIYAMSGLEPFARTFMPKVVYARTPLMHEMINTLLETKPCPRLGIVAPRGHAKSSKSSVIFPLFEALKISLMHGSMDQLYIIVSESQAQSIRFVDTIAKNIEKNKRIRYYFGDLIGKKWTQEEILLANGVRIMAKGTGQKIRGSVSGGEAITRPNIIVLDDFESEANSGTKEMIQKNKEWISGAVEPSLADDGILVAIGTIIDMSAYLVDIQEDPAWKTLFFQALMNEELTGRGRLPVWPERFSYEKLMALKASYERRMLGHVWWREYMNMPIDMDNASFRAKWIKKADIGFRLDQSVQPMVQVNGKGDWIPVNITFGADFAISEDKKADFTVFFVLGQDADGQFYCIDYKRIKTGNTTYMVDLLIELILQYCPMVANLETVQFQQAVANQLYRAMEERGVYCGITETNPRTSKDARILSLQAPFARGKMLIQEWMTDLESELLMYPKSKHDDLLDGLYLAHSVSSPCDGTSLAATAGDGLREPERRRDWLTA